MYLYERSTTVSLRFSSLITAFSLTSAVRLAFISKIELESDVTNIEGNQRARLILAVHNKSINDVYLFKISHLEFADKRIQYSHRPTKELTIKGGECQEYNFSFEFTPSPDSLIAFAASIKNMFNYDRRFCITYGYEDTKPVLKQRELHSFPRIAPWSPNV